MAITLFWKNVVKMERLSALYVDSLEIDYLTRPATNQCTATNSITNSQAGRKKTKQTTVAREAHLTGRV